MIKKFILVFILSVLGVGLFVLNNYLQKQDSFILKEIYKYDKLIFELKKINKINKEIKKTNIPIFTHKQAQQIILNTLDNLSKQFKVVVHNYQDENNMIKVDFALLKELKRKKDILEVEKLFLGFYPVLTIYKNFVYQNPKILLHNYLIILYGDKNAKR
jgi:hypothetical protein